ncbi:MAG: hypothetical protein WA154_11145 [Moraxellaceae bacterium]
MGRPRATKADGLLPPYVYRKPKANLVEYRPYLGKGKFGQSVYLKDAEDNFLPFTASRDAIFKAYAAVTGTEKPARTLSWLLGEYVASPRYARLMPATRKHYDHYRAAIEGTDLSNGRTFGQVPLEKITRGVIAKYRDSMAKAPIQANRHLQFLGAVFSFALEREYVSQNPVTGVEKNRQPPRTHYVEDRDYWLAYSLAPDWLKAFMELAYLCRGRRGEILALKSREHVLEEGVYLQRTKGSASEVTAWSDRLKAAVALARTHNRDVLSPYLLHGADGKPVSGPAFNSAWKRLMEKVKAAKGAAFPAHDLKAKGITDHTEHASGHKSARMADVYIRKPDLVPATR